MAKRVAGTMASGFERAAIFGINNAGSSMSDSLDLMIRTVSKFVE
jgi:hypothetical protein